MTNTQLARMPQWYRTYQDVEGLALAPAVTWRMAVGRAGYAALHGTAQTVRTIGEKPTQRMLKVWGKLARLGYVAVNESLQ